MESIVITGIGIVTPLGSDIGSLWDGLINGKSGVRNNGSTVAPFTAPVDHFNVESKYDRSIEMAAVCAELALSDAGKSFCLDEGTGVFISSTKGGMNSVTQDVNPLTMQNIMADSAARVVAARLDIKGMVKNIVAACATGIFALSSAIRAVRSGECKRAVIGCSESALTPLVLSGFRNMGILTQRGPNPFRKTRDGFAPAEGAAVFTLEKRAEAENRGLIFTSTGYQW